MRNSEGESPKLGAFMFVPTFKDGVAIGMKDGYHCLVKNNLAAFVGKRPQTYEGIGE